MDAMALLCTLHADGPATLKSLCAARRSTSYISCENQDVRSLQPAWYVGLADQPAELSQ